MTAGDRGSAGEPVLLRFGRFELDLRLQELRREGVLVRLQPQPFKLLVLLARRAGDLVTREELRRALWGEGTFVDFEQGLGFCVRQIRAALGEAARAPVEVIRRAPPASRHSQALAALFAALARALGLPKRH